MYFKDRNILLGLTGSIAIYKAPSLIRRIKDGGGDVSVVMTESATEFMSPLVFDTFTDGKTYTEMFKRDKPGTKHIDLVKWSDAILVAPATGNIIGKVASGIADDLLTSIIMATGVEDVIFSPAMNVNMYNNKVTQKNIEKLSELGYDFIEPGEGELACEDIGKGRFPPIFNIIEQLHKYLNGRGLMKNKKVVVTAGPTREYFDQIRYITNRSTGKMGYSIAAEAAKESAEVLLIAGPNNQKVPPGVEEVKIETAGEMGKVLTDKANNPDYLFMAAAVEDFKPKTHSQKKLKKGEFDGNIEFTTVPDIVKNFKSKNKDSCVIGFSAEAEDGENNSMNKMEEKKLDYILWNDISKNGVGFESDTNEVTLFGPEGEKKLFQKTSKRNIASQIISYLEN